MSLLARLLPWRKRSTDTTVDELLWSSNFNSVPSVTGIAVNQQTSLGASGVMACVTMLAEDVAKLPWSIFRRAEDDSRKEAKDHFLYDLLQEPNDWQNGLEFREQMQISLILRGNAYAPIIRNMRGTPIKLVPVNADWVALWEAPDGQLFYRVTPQGLHMRAELSGQPFLIPFADMFHLRGFSLNGLLGISRIAVAKEVIGLSLAQEQQAARWMGNAAKPSGILTTEQKLTPEGAERISEEWRSMVSGLQNVGRTAVLEQGLKFSPLEMASASDLEFIASRKFQLEEVARIFRVPTYMLGEVASKSTGNIQQLAQEYINYTLTGYTNRWRAKASSAFGLRKDDLSIEFDYSELTTADMGTRVNQWRTMIMSMIGKPDEARIDLGLQPEGGEADKLHFPQNMAAAGSQSTGTAPDGAGRPNGDDPTPSVTGTVTP